MLRRRPAAVHLAAQSRGHVERDARHVEEAAERTADDRGAPGDGRGGGERVASRAPQIRAEPTVRGRGDGSVAVVSGRAGPRVARGRVRRAAWCGQLHREPLVGTALEAQVQLVRRGRQVDGPSTRRDG